MYVQQALGNSNGQALDGCFELKHDLALILPSLRRTTSRAGQRSGVGLLRCQWYPQNKHHRVFFKYVQGMGTATTPQYCTKPPPPLPLPPSLPLSLYLSSLFFSLVKSTYSCSFFAQLTQSFIINFKRCLRLLAEQAKAYVHTKKALPIFCDGTFTLRRTRTSFQTSLTVRISPRLCVIRILRD